MSACSCGLAVQEGLGRLLGNACSARTAVRGSV